MALIGEQFDDAEDICGVVASVRPRQDKLSLWTKTAANEAAQVCYYVYINDHCYFINDVMHVKVFKIKVVKGKGIFKVLGGFNAMRQ